MLIKLKHFLSAAFWIVLSKMLPKKGPMLYLLGRIVGWCFYVCSPRRIKIMEEEFALIFPEKSAAEIKEMAKKSTMDYCICEVEQIGLPYLSASNIDELVTLDGRERLDEALARGKGVVAVEPHFGAYLLNLPAMGYNGYKVTQVALRGNPPPEMIEKVPETQRKGMALAAYEHRVHKIENLLPAEFINAKHNATFRKVYKKLKNNEIIAVTGTGRGGKHFAPVRLCGRNSLLSSGPFRLAMRTGATLLPMFVVRDSDMRNRLVIEEPIRLAPDADLGTINDAVQKLADLLTHYITEYPQHFGMRLWRMRVNAHFDDHPFFTDYGAPPNPAANRTANRTKGAGA